MFSLANKDTFLALFLHLNILNIMLITKNHHCIVMILYIFFKNFNVFIFLRNTIGINKTIFKDNLYISKV